MEAARVRFTIPGVPVAQPRQRHRIAKSGSDVFVHNFTPAGHPVQAYKAAMRLAAAAAYKGPPLEGPLRVVAVFVLPRPKRLKTGPRVWAPVKPDVDNLIKPWDSLNGVLWADDKQIVAVAVRKLYAGSDEQPHVDVEVITL